MNMSRIINFLLCIFFSLNLASQTADKNQGCIPLTVRFETTSATTYFWDFGDGNSSNQKSPEHIFTEAGIHKVKLYPNASSTTPLGEIEIEVYPDLEIILESNVSVECIEKKHFFRK